MSVLFVMEILALLALAALLRKPLMLLGFRVVVFLDHAMYYGGRSIEWLHKKLL